jgi:hypothetical protein
MWVLGIALYFCIACVLVRVYYPASRKLPFLTDHPLISRVNFCVWVQLFIVGNGRSENFYFRDQAFYRNGIRVMHAGERQHDEEQEDWVVNLTALCDVQVTTFRCGSHLIHPDASKKKILVSNSCAIRPGELNSTTSMVNAPFLLFSRKRTWPLTGGRRSTVRTSLRHALFRQQSPGQAASVLYSLDHRLPTQPDSEKRL